MLSCFSLVRQRCVVAVLLACSLFLLFYHSFSSYGFASEPIEKSRKFNRVPPVLQSTAVDLVVFSYDRPLQLYTLLESCKKHLRGTESVHVIYRASSEEYDEGYLDVKASFPNTVMHRQGAQPQVDFKPLVLSSVYNSNSKANYIIFAVDDNIVTGPVNLADCVQILENTRSWGFFLRLGKNIGFTYSLNQPSPVPKGKGTDAFFIWQFSRGKGDWNYPNTVDMTVYRKSDIKEFLNKADYKHPNSMEQTWQSYRPKSTSRGVCYNQSKVINIPLNIVNPSSNRHMDLYTAEDLLYMFEDGLKIDISVFENQSFNTCHVPIEPTFIDR